MNTSICLITGASRGLGLCLADQIHLSGYHTVGLARDGQALERLQEEGRLDDILVCDLSCSRDRDRAILEMERRYGKLDLLIHNAGIQESYSVLESPGYHDLVEREMEVNFLAPVHLTAGLLPMLITQPSKVVVVTSLLRYTPKVEAPGYCASKAALASWVTNLRAQLQGTGISVCEAIPGLIKTSMTEEAAERGVCPSVLARSLVSQWHRDTVVLPGGRLGWWLQRLAPELFRSLMLKR